MPNIVNQQIKYQKNSFQGKYDTQIVWRKWLPNADRTATLLLVHGLNEYPLRYKHLINHIIPRKIAVYALDHRGHGESSGERGYIREFIDFIDDLKLFFKQIVLKESQNKPIFILGHSMGSVITMNYTRLYPDQLKGMILWGTGYANNVSPLLLFLGKIGSVITPRLKVKLPFAKGWLTRNQVETDNSKADPFCHSRSTARLSYEISHWLKIGSHQVNQITLPTLIQVGEADTSFKRTGEVAGKSWFSR